MKCCSKGVLLNPETLGVASSLTPPPPGFLGREPGNWLALGPLVTPSLCSGHYIAHGPWVSKLGRFIVVRLTYMHRLHGQWICLCTNNNGDICFHFMF